MVDVFSDSFDSGWDDIPPTLHFLPGDDVLSESFDAAWDDVPPPELAVTPTGQSFFLYRSCDLSATGTRDALIRNDDIITRGVALIDEPGGVPTDGEGASDNPTIDIIDAEWGPSVPGDGQLPPGTYPYDAIPVDVCTGRTGKPIALPALTIRRLGDVATLRVQLGERPNECTALQLRRDGEIVGPPFPDLKDVPESTTIIEQPNPFGNYDFGTDKNFRRLGFDTGDPNDFTSGTADPVDGRRPGPGADLVGGDAIRYNGFTVKVDIVNPWPIGATVDTGVGQEIRFEPPIPSELITPPGVYDSANRSGFYEAVTTQQSLGDVFTGGFNMVPSAQYVPKWPPFTGIPWPGPWASFMKIPPSTFGILPYLDDVQPGDIIAIGSKTGLVVYVERNPLAFPDSGSGNPQFGTVLYIPFGLLPIPPLALGQYWVVYRSNLIPTFFTYYTLGDFFPGTPAQFSGPSDFDDPLIKLIRGRETFQAGGGLDDRTDFLYPEGGSQNNGYDPTDIPNERTALKAFRVSTYDVVEDPPGSNRFRPEFLPQGQLIIYDFSIVTVQFVNEIMPPTGLFPGEYEVEVTPLNPTTTEVLPDLSPLPLGPITIDPRPGVPIGPAITIPSFLSPYLKPATISPFGQYERITRLVDIRTEDDVWSYDEDGADLNRTGTVDGTDARTEVDDVFVQNNYPGGLDGLLERLRGPQTTTPEDVFVKTIGHFTQAGPRLIATNSPMVELGSGSIVDLGIVRSKFEDFCDDAKYLTELTTLLNTDGFAIMRLEAREVQVPAARCPPDQPDAREIKLFCLGFATQQTKLKDGELARVYFGVNSRFTDSQVLRLQTYGLTESEAEQALTLTTSGRVITAEEITEQDLGTIEDFNGISDDPEILGEILDIDRVATVNTGTINRPQIQEYIRRRGQAGITFRPPGTDPEGPAADEPIEDFALPIHQLAGLTMQLQASFDVCDFDAALASIDDVDQRNLMASFFAVVEGTLDGLIQAGRALLDFLQESDFANAAEAIAGIIAASATDPTLKCFGGVAAATPGFPGAPTFNAVDGFFADFARGFQQRFDLTQLLGQAIASVLCSILGALTEVIAAYGGEFAGAAAQEAMSCIPTQDVLDALGIEWPSIEAQVAIECSLDQMNILLDIINALIAEANEIIDFGNELNTGFVTRTVEARNRACSSGEGIAALVGGLRAFVGLG
jgi:hypothetical protein